MYGIEIRNKVFSLLESGKSLKEVSEFLTIHPQTIQNWLTRLKSLGTIAPKAHGLRNRKIDKAQLVAYIAHHPDHTLKQIAAVFNVSTTAIFKSFKTMAITLKKNHWIPGTQRRR